MVQDIPPYSTCDGHPARIRGLNREGLKRRGLSEEALRAMKEAYRLCYDSDLPREEAYREISARGYGQFPEVALFVEFLQAVAKGRHGRALEAEREVVPAEERDGRLGYKAQQAEG